MNGIEEDMKAVVSAVTEEKECVSDDSKKHSISNEVFENDLNHSEENLIMKTSTEVQHNGNNDFEVNGNSLNDEESIQEKSDRIIYEENDRTSENDEEPSFHIFDKNQENELNEIITRLGVQFHGISELDFRKIAFEYAEINDIRHNFDEENRQTSKKWYLQYIKLYPYLNHALKTTECNFSSEYTDSSNPIVDKFLEDYKSKMLKSQEVATSQIPVSSVDNSPEDHNIKPDAITEVNRELEVPVVETEEENSKLKIKDDSTKVKQDNEVDFETTNAELSAVSRTDVSVDDMHSKPLQENELETNSSPVTPSNESKNISENYTNEIIEAVNEIATDKDKFIEVPTEIAANADEIIEAANEMSVETNKILEIINEIAADTDKVIEVPTEIAVNADQIIETANEMAVETNKIFEIMNEIAADTDKVIEATTEIAPDTDKIIEVTAEIADTDKIIEATTEIAPDTDKIIEASTEISTNADKVIEATTEFTVDADQSADDIIKTGKHVVTKEDQSDNINTEFKDDNKIAFPFSNSEKENSALEIFSDSPKNIDTAEVSNLENATSPTETDPALLTEDVPNTVSAQTNLRKDSEDIAESSSVESGSYVSCESPLHDVVEKFDDCSNIPENSISPVEVNEEINACENRTQNEKREYENLNTEENLVSIKEKQSDSPDRIGIERGDNVTANDKLDENVILSKNVTEESNRNENIFDTEKKVEELNRDENIFDTDKKIVENNVENLTEKPVDDSPVCNIPAEGIVDTAVENIGRFPGIDNATQVTSNNNDKNINSDTSQTLHSSSTLKRKSDSTEQINELSPKKKKPLAKSKKRKSKAKRSKYLYKLKSFSGSELYFTSPTSVTFLKPVIKLTKLDESKYTDATKETPFELDSSTALPQQSSEPSLTKNVETPVQDSKLEQLAAKKPNAGEENSTPTFGMQTRKKRLKFLPDGTLVTPKTEFLDKLFATPATRSTQKRQIKNTPSSDSAPSSNKRSKLASNESSKTESLPEEKKTSDLPVKKTDKPVKDPYRPPLQSKKPQKIFDYDSYYREKSNRNVTSQAKKLILPKQTVALSRIQSISESAKSGQLVVNPAQLLSCLLETPITQDQICTVRFKPPKKHLPASNQINITPSKLANDDNAIKSVTKRQLEILQNTPLNIFNKSERQTVTEQHPESELNTIHETGTCTTLNEKS